MEIADCADASLDLDLLAGSLVFGRIEQMAELFDANHKRAPLIIWSPKASELPHPAIRAFAKACLSMGDGRQHLKAEQFDVGKLANLSKWLMIVDVCEGGSDFVYTHYGEGISKYYRRDMTGYSTSQFGGYISAFFSALYRAAMIRKDWVLSEHEPPDTIFVRRWCRLAVPLTDGLGEVVRFAVLNIPENELRGALDSVAAPCLVADPDMNLVHANPTACDLLDRMGATAPPLALPKVFGSSLEIEETPTQLLAADRHVTRGVRLRTATTRGHGQSDVAQATVAGVSFGKRTYYVITLSGDLAERRIA